MSLGNIMQTSQDVVKRSWHFGEDGFSKDQQWVPLGFAGLVPLWEEGPAQQTGVKTIFLVQVRIKAKDSHKVLELPKAFKIYWYLGVLFSFIFV